MRTTWHAAWAPFTGAFLALVVGCATPRVGEGEKSLPSTVVRLKGSARYAYSDDKGWMRIRGGEVLEPGARIQTAAGSIVDLVLGAEPSTLPRRSFPDTGSNGRQFPPERREHRIRIYPDSMLSLKQVAKPASAWWAQQANLVALDLMMGKILCHVEKPWRLLAFTVTSSNVVARVEESPCVFTVLVDVVTVLQGQIAVTFTDTDEIEHVRSGEMVRSRRW